MDRLVNFLESLGETMVLGNSVQTWLVCTLIVVAGVLLTRLARFLFSRYLPKLAQLSETELDDYIVEGAIGPLAAMVLLPALHVAAHILDMPAGIRKLCEHAVAIAFALLVTMVAVRAVDALFRHGLGPWKTRDGKHLDPQVIASVASSARS